jgi:hypothetical protein
MRAILIFFAVIALTACSSNAHAEDVYTELSVQRYVSKSDTDSYTGTSLYVEVPVSTDSVSLWGTIYHDKLFQGVYAGVAKKYGDWQIALGVGTVRDDGIPKNVINPWVYYRSDTVEAYMHAEHYSKDSDPWWYKGYVQKKLSDSLFAGVYGEKDFGIGPIMTWEVAKGVKLWATVPVAHKPKEEGMKFLLGIKFVFE